MKKSTTNQLSLNFERRPRKSCAASRILKEFRRQQKLVYLRLYPERRDNFIALNGVQVF